jgi:hypothetical protein
MKQVCWVGYIYPLIETPPSIQPNRSNMTKQDLLNAIQFMERMVVGVGDQDRFFQTLEALKTELARRSKTK